jgi:hypothetical protein
VLGIGLASLFSDWSHETATTLLPAFLATMGMAAAWLIIDQNENKTLEQNCPGSKID